MKAEDVFVIARALSPDEFERLSLLIMQVKKNKRKALSCKDADVTNYLIDLVFKKVPSTTQ